MTFTTLNGLNDQVVQNFNCTSQ